MKIWLNKNILLKWKNHLPPKEYLTACPSFPWWLLSPSLLSSLPLLAFSPTFSQTQLHFCFLFVLSISPSRLLWSGIWGFERELMKEEQRSSKEGNWEEMEENDEEQWVSLCRGLASRWLLVLQPCCFDQHYCSESNYQNSLHCLFKWTLAWMQNIKHKRINK